MSTTDTSTEVQPSAEEAMRIAQRAIRLDQANRAAWESQRLGQREQARIDRRSAAAAQHALDEAIAAALDSQH